MFVSRVNSFFFFLFFFCRVYEVESSLKDDR